MGPASEDEGSGCVAGLNYWLVSAFRAFVRFLTSKKRSYVRSRAVIVVCPVTTTGVFVVFRSPGIPAGIESSLRLKDPQDVVGRPLPTVWDIEAAVGVFGGCFSVFSAVRCGVGVVVGVFGGVLPATLVYVHLARLADDSTAMRSVLLTAAAQASQPRYNAAPSSGFCRRSAFVMLWTTSADSGLLAVTASKGLLNISATYSMDSGSGCCRLFPDIFLLRQRLIKKKNVFKLILTVTLSFCPFETRHLNFPWW